MLLESIVEVEKLKFSKKKYEKLNHKFSIFRWRGSVYKLLYLDLIAYLSVYYMIHLVYRNALNDQQKQEFESVITYCRSYSNFFPISFVLGFFVSIIMARWWNQYMSIPRPTSCAVYVSSLLHGHDEIGRAMRRTIMRYVCVSITMVSFKLFM